MESVMKSPWFITARNLFLGAFFTQLEEAYSAGHLDFSLKALTHCAIGGLILTGFSMYHLYQMPPNAFTAAECKDHQSSPNQQ